MIDTGLIVIKGFLSKGVWIHTMLVIIIGSIRPSLSVNTGCVNMVLFNSKVFIDNDFRLARDDIKNRNTGLLTQGGCL